MRPTDWNGDAGGVEAADPAWPPTRTSRASTCSPAFALAGTLQVLKQKGLLVAADRPQARLHRLQRRHPRGAQGHRGRPDRRHRLASRPTCTPSTACTTSRPRSTGKTFKPGPTDHGSTIIQVRDGLLEDQLAAPLVTADGAAYRRCSRRLKSTTRPCGATTHELTRAGHPTTGTADTVRPVVEAVGHHQAVRLHRRARPAPASRSGRGRPTRWSAATAPASRPWSASSPGCRRRTPGRSPSPASPPRRSADRDAWRRRVACVYQKSTIIPTLTVAENLFLNRHDRGPGRLIRWRRVRRAGRASCWRPGRWTSTCAQPAGDARASSSGSSSRSPGRCRSAPGSSSSTSPPPSSTPPASTGCSPGSATCSSRASPSCSSATTCRRSTRSATRSRSSATPGTSSPRRSPSSPGRRWSRR